MGDDRVISCMNAVKSVECVLKKAQNNWENPWKKQENPYLKWKEFHEWFQVCGDVFLDVSSPKKRGHGNLTGLWSCCPPFRGCA